MYHSYAIEMNLYFYRKESILQDQQVPYVFHHKPTDNNYFQGICQIACEKPCHWRNVVF